MTKKRRYSITAHDDDVVPVLASYMPSRKGNKIPTTHLAYLSCEACNTEVLGSNTVAPFCVCCASEMKPTSDKTLEVPGTEIENEFDKVAECPECATVVTKRTDIEASFDDGKLYCPTCTHQLSVIADDDSEDSDSEDDASEDADMSETVDDDSGESEDGLFDNDAGEGGDSDSTNSGEDNTETDTETKSDEGNSSGDTPTDTPPEDNSNSGGSTLNANLVQALSGKSGSISVVASPDKSKWFLFLDNTPVASASKDNASDNVKGIFDTDKFASSWSAATTDGVTEDLLNDFGFTANTVDVPVDEAVKQNLEASIAEEKAKISITAAEIQSRFERCFGIAAVGINKQVFKENNPVKRALVASLKSRNVRDAEKIVTAAFSEHGEEMLANVSEKAAELMDKSDETLDEMAKAVDEAKAAKHENDSDNSDNKEPEKKPAPKLTTFPKQEDDKPQDANNQAENHNDNDGSEHSMAASDIDDVFARMARRLRKA